MHKAPQITPDNDVSSIELGRRVILTESDGLRRLADTLDETFEEAVKAIESIRGRVVITGMGKSGHIGRKFAATLSSTGKPAYFVHPGEASHGDMGMITPDDGVIALSNSGETAELQDIVGFCRRNSLTLIGITQSPDSALARNATVALSLPNLPEACPHNLAPTTSTSLMLALCDALAVVLLQRRHFTPSDFHLFHPGGQLGRRLRTLREVMHTGADIPLISRTAHLREAILEMTSKRFGCVGVLDHVDHVDHVDHGSLIGILTDGDLRRTMDSDSALKSEMSVDMSMTKNPITLKPDDIVEAALGCMHDNKITVVFVVDSDNHPIGIIHIHDLL